MLGCWNTSLPQGFYLKLWYYCQTLELTQSQWNSTCSSMSDLNFDKVTNTEYYLDTLVSLIHLQFIRKTLAKTNAHQVESINVADVIHSQVTKNFFHTPQKSNIQSYYLSFPIIWQHMDRNSVISLDEAENPWNRSEACLFVLLNMKTMKLVIQMKTLVKKSKISIFKH